MNYLCAPLRFVDNKVEMMMPDAAQQQQQQRQLQANMKIEERERGRKEEYLTKLMGNAFAWFFSKRVIEMFCY